MSDPAANAQLALLLEVAGTPKPGNVDRQRDLDGLRFEHFLAGAVGSLPGLRAAADGAAVGPAFERSVAGMASRAGQNTQFGALLLLVPLVRAARTDLSPPVVESVVEGTTVTDAKAFYRAFDHVSVSVDDPPAGLEPLDVRRGSDAIPAVESHGVTLADVLAESAPTDDVAREWITSFERTFLAAERLGSDSRPVLDRCGRTFLSLLAERPDTLIATQHGNAVAETVTQRAEALVERNAFVTDREAVERFGDDLVSRGINPGTTADLVAAGLFVALEREAIRVR